MSPNTRRRPTAEAHKHHRAASVSLAFALIFTLVAATGLTRVAPAQGPALDFEALALEVTQGIQNLNNTVRLVAGKTTFVRFYVRTNGEAAAVSALLRVSGPAGTLDLLPINSGGAILAVPAPDRRRNDAAFLFAVPTALTAPGNVSFQALVNPGGQVPEASAANNLLTIPSLTFEAVPTLNLVIYNLAYTVNGTTHIAPDSHPAQMVNWMARTWPVADIQFRILRDHAGNALPTCDQVNRFLATKRALDAQSGNLAPNTRYYGMVADTGGFMRGCADDLPGYNSSGPTGTSGTPNSFPWDRDGTFGDWYGSHEVAHSFNRLHAEFCEATAGAPFPYPRALIGPTAFGPTANFGFDIMTGDILPGGIWSDNMAYCDFQWMSDFTYHGLMDALINDVRPKPPSAPADSRRAAVSAAADTPQDRLLVQGTILLPGSGHGGTEVVLEQPFVIPQSIDATTHEDGPYAIVLRGAAGAELQRYPFDPGEVAEDSEDPEAVADAPDELRPRLSVGEMMPVTAQNIALATRLDIEGPGGVVLKSVNAGLLPPAVQFAQPSGGQTFSGEVIASWTASDPNGDALTYILQYSDDDGATWETVDAYLGETSAVVDTLDLTGGQQARFRVLASDGIRTSIAVSNSFAIPNEPPSAEIVEPAGGRTLRQGQPLALFGEGYDPDSGSLPSSQIKWSSSIAGQLGTGNQLTVASLAPGAHTLTLTADDGAGGVATDSVEIVIRANNAPPLMQFDELSYSVNEGDGAASIAVFRAGDASAAAAVEYAASPGTASDRTDYTIARGTLLFAPGEVSKTIRILVADDGFEEGAETLTITLANPSGVELGTPASATLAIEDNDDADAAANVLDDAAFFVRQHYADFLLREPEPAGLSAWLQVLNACPKPFNSDPNNPSARCDRVTVSTGFFRSPEFELRGLFVYRLYSTGLNRQPTYAEMIPDMQFVTGATPAEVFQRRDLFAASFASRAEFQPTAALDAAGYVNRLMDRYGLQSITAPDPAAPNGGTKVTFTRAELIARLGSAALSRAQVLRAIADSDQVAAAEFNRGFVTIQYFGYLRRDPEAAGFQSWLNYLNRNPTDLYTMVNGFVNSVEYRLRFGRP